MYTVKNVFVHIDLKTKTVTADTFATAHDAFASCQQEWAAHRPALYCDQASIEATKAEVFRRYTEGWKTSAAPAAAPQEQPKPVPAPTKKASVQLTINFVASYDAGHPENASANWTVDLSTVGGSKELTGVMKGTDVHPDGTPVKVTDDSVTLTALLEGLRALKRPCEVDVLYPRKGKALNTLEGIIKRQCKTSAGKDPANLNLIKAIAPFLEMHDCIFVQR